MDTKLFDDAIDIGEDMAILRTQGKSWLLGNKATGQTRLFVDASGFLAVDENEIDEAAIRKGCPHYHGERMVRYGFGRYSDFKNGLCALYWTLYPDGRYFADEDGFGMDDNDEEEVYCIINKDLEVVVPFQPIDDVNAALEKESSTTSPPSADKPKREHDG